MSPYLTNVVNQNVSHSNVTLKEGNNNIFIEGAKEKNLEEVNILKNRSTITLQILNHKETARALVRSEAATIGNWKDINIVPVIIACLPLKISFSV